MTVQASTMIHSFTLVEDWLSLEHWSTFGTNEREYQIRHGVPVGVGSALWVGDQGRLGIERETDIAPGVPHVLTVLMFNPGGARPCNIQVRNIPGQSGSANIFAVNAPLTDGWNRVVVNFTASGDWEGVWLSLFTTLTGGGLIGPIRAVPAVNGDD